ncbi:hypothetical protein [Chitinophaga sp. RAB17]|uniref:hypothetical protein n=1 Tax=Chitinophaga sp. RAB17 TaxID=3233049 RepID=UPI003F8E3675
MNKMSFLAIKRLSLFLFVLMAVSCRKGDLPEESYFGKVYVSLMNLPNTPTVMMYFDGKPLDTIKVIGGSSYIVPAGKKGKLAAFDAASKELLADTLISIPPNGKQQFKFAYSPEFGLKGFIAEGSSANVPADSFDVRLFNNLSATFYPKEKYDLSFIFLDPVSGEVVTSNVVVKGWERKKLSSTLRFRVVTDDGKPYFYAAQLIDPETGAVVLQPNQNDLFVFLGDNVAGKSKITTVADDNNGVIYINEIDL